MTQEEAKEYLPIIKAFADGEAIEFYHFGAWRNAIAFDPEMAAHYRIKPEPLEFDVWVCPVGDRANATDSDMLPYACEGWRKIRVREITE